MEKSVIGKLNFSVYLENSIGFSLHLARICSVGKVLQTMVVLLLIDIVIML